MLPEVERAELEPKVIRLVESWEQDVQASDARARARGGPPYPAAASLIIEGPTALAPSLRD